jgi:crotonobetainyl-CoA:carnitine CoA-transferase CaiB-like acyl-CoA transferase
VFLHGVTVLQAGCGIAGSWAGATFRDFGATVSRLPWADSPFEAVLNHGKGIITGDSLERVLAEIDGPDVVICDRIENADGDWPAELGAYLEFVERLNRSVWVTISAFGSSGPSASWSGSDLTVSAAAGVLAYARDGSGEPSPLPGRQSLLAAGQAAVLAGLHGLDRWRSSGTPVHLDVSAQEAMIATGPVLQCTETTLNYALTGGMRRFGAPSGWFACSDGPIYIALHEDHHWAGIKRAIRPPEPIAGLVTADDRIKHGDDIDRLMLAWTSQRTRADAESRLQAEGVPVTALNSLQDLQESATFGFRATWRKDDVGGRIVTTLETPYVIQRQDQPGAYQRADAPGRVRRLAGLRVVEASHILAASLAGSILGAMGANVIKIETADRLDQYRRSGPFIDGRKDQEWSGFFSTANHSKHSYLFSDTAELEPVIADADVVLENFGRGRAGRLGLDSRSVGQRWPDKLGVSCSGFGHSGPLAGYRVYAANLNAFCGLLHSLRDTSGEVGTPGVSWADYVSAYALATVVAAWAVGSGPAAGSAGKVGSGPAGAQVDMAMAEVVVQRLSGVLIAEAGGAALGGGGPAGATDWLFKTDDGYVAVTSRGEDDLRQLRAVAGTLASGTGDEMRGAFAVMPGAAVAGMLQGAGVPAAVVVNAEELTRDRHLTAREFFRPVDHPGWGRRRLVGLPWRFAGEPAIALTAPPTLGNANGPDPWGERE